MIANSRVQTDTEILMDAQTEVKLFIQDAVNDFKLTLKFKENLLKVIDDNIKEVKNKDLKKKARETLYKYGIRQYKMTLKTLTGVVVTSLYLTMNKSEKIGQFKAFNTKIKESKKNTTITDYNKTFVNLGNSQAKTSFSQSLYGYSELNARYEEQQDMIKGLKEKTNLVICDSHSDCSDRCKPWQGKIYSLDGTTGYTEDGKKYIPLEKATQVVDKYGHINGLLGYNCRHRLYAYKKGMKEIKVSEKERKREYAITQQQRLLERKIRELKDKALQFKHESENTRNDTQTRKGIYLRYKQYKSAVDKAIAEYKGFCEKYKRTEYRSRLKI